MKDNDDDFLYRQLDNLGQMIADGLADEPDGKWIRQQYKGICRTLGLLKPTKRKRKASSDKVNDFMKKRIETVKCSKCGGDLRQSRSGSFIGVCIKCKAKFRLGRNR